MNHLSEGQLQAYLDDAVDGAAMRRLSTHLETCAACAATLETMRATATRAAHALAWLDRPASTAAAAEVVGANDDVAVRRIDAHRPWGRPARVGFLKAAMLALLVSGAAAAAIPGSPVQRWLVSAWERVSAPEPVMVGEPQLQPDGQPVPADEAVEPPASISIEPADGRLRVELSGAAAGQLVRVTLVDGATATVETDSDVTTRFSTGPSSIEASSLGDGTVTVLLPRGLARASVASDGQILFAKDGTTVRAPGAVVERTDDTIVFRMP